MKMQKSFGLQFKGRNAVVAAAVVIAGSVLSNAAMAAGTTSIGRFAGHQVKTGGILTLDTGVNGVLSGGAGGHGLSDVAVTWQGGGANNKWSTGANWVGGVAPTGTGSDPTFGATPTGNYTTVNDLSATAFGTMTVNRTAATDTVTLQGGYKGSSISIANGKLVLDGGTSTVTHLVPTTGAVFADYSINLGTTATGNASLVIQNGAVVNYADARAGGTATSVTAITVTGAGTKLQRGSATYESLFGGGGGNSTILVDAGASVETYLSRTAMTGSYKITNGSSVVVNPAGPADSGIAYFGNVTGSTVSWEVSGNSTLTVNDDASASAGDPNDLGFIWVGAGPGSNTTGNILSGGKVHGGLVALTSGYIASTATSVVSGTSTTNVSGTGSQLTAEDLAIGGLGVFSNSSIGTTNLNVLNGGLAAGDDVFLIAGPRNATIGTPAVPTPPVISNIDVSGAGSILRGGQTTADGIIYIFGGEGGAGTLSVENGGSVLGNVLYDNSATSGTAAITIGANGTMNIDEIQIGSGDGTAGTTIDFKVKAGGQVTSTDFVSGDGVGALLRISVDGAGSSLKVAQFYQNGGFSDSSFGAGETDLTVTNGGSASLGLANIGLADSFDSVSAAGSSLNVDGVGSVIKVTGYTDAVAANDLPAVVLLGTGQNNVATINVTNGGLFDINAVVAADPANDISGDLEMANNYGSKATVNVTGLGSTLNAGTGLFMAQASLSDPNGLITDASAIINVTNGGVINVAGNIQMTVQASANLVATLNIGGGTDAVNDPKSAVLADGTVFVGGSGTAATPVVGSPATINLNNGELNAGALLVYQGSTVNFVKGNLTAGLMSARGGKIVVPASTPAGQAVFQADEYEANNGGYIDIGKGGGVSYYDSTAATPDLDLGEIRTLIKAGYNNGTWDGVNSIRSGAIGSSTKLGVGYADIDISNITSFLGVTFVASDQAIVFRTTLKGDTNCDGIVNFPDLLALAQNYNPTGAPGAKDWFQGDSNYDGIVGFDDLLALAQNYNATYSLLGGITEGDSSAFAADWALAQSLVPEPTTLGLLGGVGMLMGRRRRQA